MRNLDTNEFKSISGGNESGPDELNEEHRKLREMYENLPKGPFGAEEECNCDCG